MSGFFNHFFELFRCLPMEFSRPFQFPIPLLRRSFKRMQIISCCAILAQGVIGGLNFDLPQCDYVRS